MKSKDNVIRTCPDCGQTMAEGSNDDSFECASCDQLVQVADCPKINPDELNDEPVYPGSDAAAERLLRWHWVGGNASSKITISRKIFLDLIAAAEGARSWMALHAQSDVWANRTREDLNNALAGAIAEEPK